MSALIAAVVGLALFANAPQSYGKLNMFWSAGFPFTYAHGRTGERTHFSIVALAGDIAIPLAVVTALGLFAWRSKISGGESEATISKDVRPPLAEEGRA